MDKEFIKMTELDFLTSGPHMQMIKAALPYIHIPEQRFFSVLVKCQELEHTFRLFEQNDGEAIGICSLDGSETSSPIDMLTAMKPYGTKTEQDLIEVMINFLQGARLSRAGSGSETEDTFPSSAFESLKGLLSPEQQSRFETMQLLFQLLHPST